MRLLSILLLALTTISFEDSALADLSPLAIYSKCYSLLTNDRPKLKTDVTQSVIEETLSPTDACLYLLDAAELKTDNNITKNNTAEVRSVIQTLHNFHQSWFGKLDFGTSFSAGVRGTYSLSIYDQGEPALYITRTLLSPSIPYQSIFTTNKTPAAIRFLGGKVRHNLNRSEAISHLCGSRVSGKCFFDNSRSPMPFTPWKNVRYSPKGELIGIKFSSPLTINTYDAKGAVTASHNTLLHQGGGVLGSSIYRMVTQPSIISGKFNGEAVARNWSKAIFNDLLCRPLPVIRYGDALPFVDENSTMAFRQNQSCVQCHATIDRMAGVMRNHSVTAKGRVRTTATERYMAVELITPWKVSEQPMSGWSTSIDPKYHLRPPIGQVYYRSYDGSLQLIEVTGGAQLGDELAKRRDPYVCAARRYYEFLTGIRATVNDIEDPGFPRELTEEEIFHRKKVIAFGESLYKHQSLKKLISEIISDPVFREEVLVFGMEVDGEK